MMKLVSMLLSLCMVLCMLPVPAAADDLPVVKLDVGTTETYDDTNYKVDADTIILRAEDRLRYAEHGGYGCDPVHQNQQS